MSDAGLNSFSKWSDLPKELLDFILSKMSFVSILNFKAVCPSWRNAVKAYRRVNQVPLLMLPRKEEDDTSIRFLSLQDGNVFKRTNTPQEFYKGLCLGTSHGWLVMLEENVDPCLFNPFSLAKIPLPKLETYPDIQGLTRSVNGYKLDYFDGSLGCTRPVDSVQVLRQNFVSKAVISSNPNNGNFFVLMIFPWGDYEESQLAFYRSGDNQWVRLGDDYQERYRDVVCHSDKFFAWNYPNKVEIWDVHDSPPVKNSEIIAESPQTNLENMAPFPGYFSTRTYLVEVSGDLFLVERFIGDILDEGEMPIQGEDRYKTILFQVYKLNFSMKIWEKVESLGDQVFFLGGNQSKSLSVRDIPVCEANSIYFTDDSWNEIHNKDNIHYDLGIFNMEDKSIKSFYQCDLLTEPPPFWIDPEHLFDP